jgi:putative glutamine amidotransferase
MYRPVIGITTSVESEGPDQITQQVLGHTYVEAVERAGGCPVIVPVVQEKETLDAVVALLDGLIITGGPGITDRLIGELPDDLPPVSPERDRTDKWIYEASRKKDVPILGICYGMQFINARFGGSIFADVQVQRDVDPHSPKRLEGMEIRHQLSVVDRSHLSGVIGAGNFEVNSYHIQAVDSLGEGLEANALSDDGLVEGFESKDGRILGVQFHPEKLPDTIWERVFDYLVTIARKT